MKICIYKSPIIGHLMNLEGMGGEEIIVVISFSFDEEIIAVFIFFVERDYCSLFM